LRPAEFAFEPFERREQVRRREIGPQRDGCVDERRLIRVAPRPRPIEARARDDRAEFCKALERALDVGAGVADVRTESDARDDDG
jgi:hypothetical protein